MSLDLCPHKVDTSTYCPSCVDDRIRFLADMGERTFELTQNLLNLCYREPRWADLSAVKRHRITSTIQSLAKSLTA